MYAQVRIIERELLKKVYRWCIALSVVISIRIPKRLKEDLEKLGINYSEAVRNLLEEFVRREKARRLRKSMEEISKKFGRIDGDLATQFIREDRDGR